MNTISQTTYLLRKLFWFFAAPIRRGYWFIVRPNTKGVKIVIKHSDTFFLVRLNYAHRQWTFPGGAVDPNETWEAAAQREAFEETGIWLPKLNYIGEYTSKKEFKNDTVQIFYGLAETLNFKIDPFEIKEGKWFAQNELPADRVQRVDEILDFYDRSI